LIPRDVQRPPTEIEALCNWMFEPETPLAEHQPEFGLLRDMACLCKFLMTMQTREAELIRRRMDTNSFHRAYQFTFEEGGRKNSWALNTKIELRWEVVGYRGAPDKDCADVDVFFGGRNVFFGEGTSTTRLLLRYDWTATDNFLFFFFPQQLFWHIFFFPPNKIFFFPPDTNFDHFLDQCLQGLVIQSPVNVSTYVGTPMPTEDDVLHSEELPDFSGTLSRDESEMLFSYLVVDYARIPMVLNFFAEKDRVTYLINEELQQLLTAALFESGKTDRFLPVYDNQYLFGT
jgi:hypothetical protein